MKYGYLDGDSPFWGILSFVPGWRRAFLPGCAASSPWRACFHLRGSRDASQRDGTPDWAWTASETGSAAGSESGATGRQISKLKAPFTFCETPCIIETKWLIPPCLFVSWENMRLLLSNRTVEIFKSYTRQNSNLQSLLLCCLWRAGRWASWPFPSASQNRSEDENGLNLKRWGFGEYFNLQTG